MGKLNNRIFCVNRNNLGESKLLNETVPDADSLATDEVLFKVSHFALTANNITYAVIGEMMRYWEFFPVASGWGAIPVWGFADVEASNHESVKVGDRYYGYFPMADYLLSKVGRISATGFSDGTTHRATLAAVYNSYIDIRKDPGFKTGNEAMQMIFRPLFTTAFLLNDLLESNNFFEAKQIILTSASSKTAFALAFLLSRQQDRQFEVVGLTSAGNLKFVENLGYYDRVYAYEDQDNMPKLKSARVDFSGNLQLLKDMENHLGEQLLYSSLVGLVHWQDRMKAGEMKVKGNFFFAPDYIRDRLKDWGPAKYLEAVTKAWSAFVEANGDTLEIEEIRGIDNLEPVYLKMLQGKASAKKGFVIST